MINWTEDLERKRKELESRIEQANDKTWHNSVLAKLALAYFTATTDDSERALRPEISPPERKILEMYGNDLGIGHDELTGLEHLVSSQLAVNVLRELDFANSLSKRVCTVMGMTRRVSREKMNAYANVALHDDILDPEEFILLETIAKLEQYEDDYFFGMLKKANVGRNLGLIQQTGTLRTLRELRHGRCNRHISSSLQKSGFTVAPLDCSSYPSFKSSVQKQGVNIIAIDSACKTKLIDKCTDYFRIMQREGLIIPKIVIFAQKYDSLSLQTIRYGKTDSYAASEIKADKVSYAKDNIRTIADIMNLCASKAIPVARQAM